MSSDGMGKFRHVVCNECRKLLDSLMRSARGSFSRGEMVMPVISGPLQMALLPVAIVAVGAAIGAAVSTLLNWTLMNESYRRKLAELDRKIILLEPLTDPALIQYYRNAFEKESREAQRFPAGSNSASIPKPGPSEPHQSGDDIPERTTGGNGSATV
jgi:hypothetical protein